MIMRALAVVAMLAAAVPATAAPEDLRTVADMANHSRVFVAFAPSLRDPRLAEQRQTMARAALEASTRDLVFVQVADETVIGARDSAHGLRRRFHVPPAAYRTLLIGKDGNVALTAAAPLDAGRLIGAIDAMPMRQQEVRRARAGRGRQAD